MSTENYSNWMTQALDVATHSLPEDIPVGCLLLQKTTLSDGRMAYDKVGQGYNTREKEHSPSGHAEILALEQASQMLGRWRLTDCIAVVTLEPCPMCAAALLQSRVSSIIFGAFSAQEGALGTVIDLSQIYHHDTAIIGGILEADCQHFLEAFFKPKRP